MIIVGASGFAKELLEVCHELGQTEDLIFFDNVTPDLPEFFFGQFKIIKTEEEVKHYFKIKNKYFALGVGNSSLRMKMTMLFEAWGGQLSSIISPKANIGVFNVQIGPGATILANANITGFTCIGKGILMYPNSIITHDCVLGDFVELSPGATILGNCRLSENVHIGANATILPNLTIGANVIVGAGSVVTKNIEQNRIIKGIPAK
jgi:sugar O-acyltransferase (sialic acid O-acetyltransferase NeuD family)